MDSRFMRRVNCKSYHFFKLTIFWGDLCGMLRIMFSILTKKGKTEKVLTTLMHIWSKTRNRDGISNPTSIFFLVQLKIKPKKCFDYPAKATRLWKLLLSSVLRQGGNKKTKHTKFSEKWTFLAFWGKKCSFFEKPGVLWFLATSAFSFALLP